MSGLVTAWLLSKDHQVVLFEAAEDLGGNARSFVVNVAGSPCRVTPGATFILPGAYPFVTRLLRHLSVKVQRQSIDISVLDEAGQVRWASPRKSCVTGVSRRGDAMGWARLLSAAWRLERRGDWFVTWERFVAGIGGPSVFLDDVGVPVVSSLWGVRPSEMAPFVNGH